MHKHHIRQNFEGHTFEIFLRLYHRSPVKLFPVKPLKSIVSCNNSCAMKVWHYAILDLLVTTEQQQQQLVHVLHTRENTIIHETFGLKTCWDT